MREARNFILTFDPKSAEDYMAAMMGPNSAHVRMVTSYWEMAASFVVSGAIDATMFEECNGEHILVFGKIEPFLPQLRAMVGTDRVQEPGTGLSHRTGRHRARTPDGGAHSRVYGAAQFGGFQIAHQID